MVERPRHSKLRHAERIYLIRVHRHQLTPDGILLGSASAADTSCPRCQNGESYQASPWAIWDHPHSYPSSEAALKDIAEYVRTHPGWHHASTIAAAWKIPESANLVHGIDNKTLGWGLGQLGTWAEFQLHRHKITVGEYDDRVTTWVTRSDTPAVECPGCHSTNVQAHCPRCGAAIASVNDVMDHVQGFNQTRGLTVWHLDPPGCTACIPTGWSD